MMRSPLRASVRSTAERAWPNSQSERLGVSCGFVASTTKELAGAFAEALAEIAQRVRHLPS